VASTRAGGVGQLELAGAGTTASSTAVRIPIMDGIEVPRAS
jgi:hypothetical protein